jgi:hypothetical protein
MALAVDARKRQEKNAKKPARGSDMAYLTDSGFGFLKDETR